MRSPDLRILAAGLIGWFGSLSPVDSWAVSPTGWTLTARAQGQVADAPPLPGDATSLSPSDDRPAAPDEPVEGLPESPPATPVELQRWISELDHEQFAVREEAQARLARAGGAAIPLLEKAAEGASLEQTSRALRALGAIGQTGQIAVFEAVQDSLEKLAKSRQRAVARRAMLELNRLGDARTRHAIARFEALGGRMKRARPSQGAQLNGLESRRPQAVLNRKWKGTDDDLVLLTRISGLETLYVTRSAPVSPEALEKLRRAMPAAPGLPPLAIQPRGDAMVGISALSQDDGCVVQGVEEGSPAEKAGLKPGDLIYSYNGTKLESFDKLVEITRELQPGTRVTLEILRREMLQTVELDLADFE